MWQRWQAIGNTVFNLTGPKFEPQTSRSRDERLANWPVSSRVIYLIKFTLIIQNTGEQAFRAGLHNIRPAKAFSAALHIVSFELKYDLF